jgi:hypothetical protein
LRAAREVLEVTHDELRSTRSFVEVAEQRLHIALEPCEVASLRAVVEHRAGLGPLARVAVGEGARGPEQVLGVSSQRPHVARDEAQRVVELVRDPLHERRDLSLALDAYELRLRISEMLRALCHLVLELSLTGA